MSDTRYGPSGSCPRCRQFPPNCRCYASKKLDIAAIRARAEAAAPGPWHAEGNTFYLCNRLGAPGHATHDGEGVCWVSLPGAWATARFISASRTDVPALCDALEAAERALRDDHTTWRTSEASCCHINQQRAEAAEALIRNYERDADTEFKALTAARARAEAAEARVKELETQLATARDDALEEAAKVAELGGCDCAYAPCPHDEAGHVTAQRIRALKAKR